MVISLKRLCDHFLDIIDEEKMSKGSHFFCLLLQENQNEILQEINSSQRLLNKNT